MSANKEGERSYLSLEWERIAKAEMKRRKEAEAERDALAAVVEQVREGFDSLHWGCNNPDHECGYRKQADALNAAPEVALDRVKAEAVRECARSIAVEIGNAPSAAQADRMKYAVRYMTAYADRIEKGESNE